MFRARLRNRQTASLIAVVLLVGFTLFAIAEQDGPWTDGPLRAYVKRRLDPPAWMYGYTEAECTENGVRYGCWEIYVKFDNQKIEDYGAISGQTVFEYLDEPKHAGQKKAKLNRITVDSYSYGYEEDVGVDRWIDAHLSGDGS